MISNHFYWDGIRYDRSPSPGTDRGTIGATTMRTNPGRNDYLLAARRCIDQHSMCIYHARRNRLLGAPEWAAMWLNQAAQHRRNYQRRMREAAEA